MRMNPHVLWATLFIISAAWFSWFFRYDQSDRDPLLFLDRWTGQLVEVGYKNIERVSLWHEPWKVVSEKRMSDAELDAFLDAPPLWKSAPLVTEPRELTDAEVFGPAPHKTSPKRPSAEAFLDAPTQSNPFADLIPPPPPGFVLDRKK